MALVLLSTIAIKDSQMVCLYSLSTNEASSGTCPGNNPSYNQISAEESMKKN